MRRRGNAGQLLGALPVAAGDADVESDDRETGEEEHWSPRCDGEEEELGVGAAAGDGGQARRRGRLPSDVGERRLRKWRLSWQLHCDWQLRQRGLAGQLLRLAVAPGWQEDSAAAEQAVCQLCQTGKENRLPG
jgi:hypothetical protein